MIDQARAFMWQMWVGTNDSNKGECVGLFNRVVQLVFGQGLGWYPIQGAQGATDILTAKNTRPDLCQQVINDPKNPNQLPSVGDWVIWDRTWGSGFGHISCAEVVSTVAFTGVEQNYVAHQVTRQQHNWGHVAGWIHFFINDPAVPPPPPPAPKSSPSPSVSPSVSPSLSPSSSNSPSSSPSASISPSLSDTDKEQNRALAWVITTLNAIINFFKGLSPFK